jgi:hypothetical protein
MSDTMNPVTLEILKNAFTAIPEEVGAALKRTAQSLTLGAGPEEELASECQFPVRKDIFITQTNLLLTRRSDKGLTGLL